jgi:hypothetical protein
MVDLPVLTSLDQLLFVLKILFTFLQDKLSEGIRKPLSLNETLAIKLSFETAINMQKRKTIFLWQNFCNISRIFAAKIVFYF